jgi:hypothetical protein
MKKPYKMHYKTEDLTPAKVWDLMALVGYRVPVKVIKRWTYEARDQACWWAAQTHLRASDNPVRVPPKPVFVLERYYRPLREVPFSKTVMKNTASRFMDDAEKLAAYAHEHYKKERAAQEPIKLPYLVATSYLQARLPSSQSILDDVAVSITRVMAKDNEEAEAIVRKDFTKGRHRRALQILRQVSIGVTGVLERGFGSIGRIR